MAFVTGTFLIDAPASALNNMGAIPGEAYENTVGVKLIRTSKGSYPYVSAQAYRYWLRRTLEAKYPEWQAAPIFRENKVAYTDGNPILYWDDDLLGYMRAPSKRADARKAREEDESRAMETPTSDTITRVSPLRVSTLVSMAPVSITEDFGVMARHEGDPVPHVHQFYRATLQALYSLDLHAVGTFHYMQRTGYRNLDDERVALAKEQDLQLVEDEKAYRLSAEQRLQRVQTLLDAMAQIEGGAKQTLHYTDVAPVATISAVTRGGNHIFAHVFGTDRHDQPIVQLDALEEALTVHEDDILSPIYVGWVSGYRDEERIKLTTWAQESAWSDRMVIDHPRTTYARLVSDMAESADEWMA